MVDPSGNEKESKKVRKQESKKAINPDPERKQELRKLTKAHTEGLYQIIQMTRVTN